MRILSVDTNDGPMSLFMAEPAGAPRGAIIVIQEAFGVTPHIQGVCEWLAESGWLAVAPALYHRADIEVFEYTDLEGAVPVMKTLTREGIDMDIDSTISYLSLFGYGPTRLGMVGFCMGGSVTLYSAATRALGAAVTFYGGGLTQGRFGFPSGLELGEQLRAPWLGLYGDQDPSIPVDDVEALRGIAAARPVPTEVVRYAAGQHGFNCDDRPSVYDAEIAADARNRTLAWFDTHLA